MRKFNLCLSLITMLLAAGQVIAAELRQVLTGQLKPSGKRITANHRRAKRNGLHRKGCSVAINLGQSEILEETSHAARVFVIRRFKQLGSLLSAHNSSRR